MIRPEIVKPASQTIMNELGYTWDSCFNKLVPLTTAEVDEMYHTTESMYAMYVTAAEYAMNHNLWKEFGITNPKLIEVIKKEWNADKFRHIWGRFDFAGGTSGKPLKLIEFNADTATAIVETSVLQYAVLKTNGLADDCQFNDVYDSMIDAFKQMDDDTDEVISAVAFSINTEEDNRTIEYIAECASVAGIDIEVKSVESLYFDRELGVFSSDDGVTITKPYNTIVKLVPWEMMLEGEPEMTDIILDLILADKLVVINPAYTLLFQSKYMLKLLYDLFKEHSAILECDTKPLSGKYVSKPIFGREGANVTIIDNNSEVAKEDGDYAGQPMIYQRYVEFDTDVDGKTYQLGSFMCNESCGVAFRVSDTPIIVNTSEFVGHYIKG